MAETRSFISDTLKAYGKKIVDNVIVGSPFLAALKENGRTSPVGGGSVIAERIYTSNISTVAFRDPKAAITISEQDPMTMIQHTYRMVNGIIPIYDVDVWRNEGAAALGNFAKDMTMKLESDIKATLCTTMFASSQAAASIDSLRATIISNTATYGQIMDSAGNFADMTVAANAFWKAQTSTATGTITLADIDAMYYSCAQGDATNTTDIILCGSAMYAKIQSLLGANQRFNDSFQAKYGFEAIFFKNALVLWDPNIVNDYIYFINSKFLALRPHNKCADGLIVSSGQEIIDTFGQVIKAGWLGNFSCTQRRSQGIITGKTAA